MSNKPLISVVSPIYFGESLTEILVERLISTLDVLVPSFEIILVDDRSPDKSWMVIQKLCAKYKVVRGIRLSRNFGQHYAITAGLDHAKGDWVVVMDGDLQDRPEEIPALYAKANEGYSVVLARRHQRQDNYFKKIFSKIFYRVLSYLTGTYNDPAVANFGIYHRSVIESICTMRESIRYFPTMVRWVGFNRTYIDVDHAARPEGKTSYDFSKRIKLATEIILAYSDKPLRLTVKAGFYISLMSFLLGIFVLFQFFSGEITVLGYPSLIVSIWFLSGIIIMIMGIVGLYIGKIFESVKERPIYIVEEKTFD